MTFLGSVRGREAHARASKAIKGTIVERNLIRIGKNLGVVFVVMSCYSGDPIVTTVIIVEVRGHQIFIGCQKNSLFGENHHCLEVRNNKRVGGIGDSWSPYYYNHWKSPKIMRNSQLTSWTRLRGAIIPYLLPRFFMDYTFLLVVTYLPFPIIKKTAIIATRGPLKYDHQS